VISGVAPHDRVKALVVEMGLAAGAEAVGRKVMTHEECPRVHFYVFRDYSWLRAT